MQTSLAVLNAAAAQIRRDSIRSTTAAASGHPTTCASAAEIMATLFFRVMKYDPKNPKCPVSDRFILSKGHAAPALYACWKIAGLLTDADVMSLRRIDSDYEGHPTPRLPFVDVATGSLGQGLGAGIGLALNSSKLDKTQYRTYVLMGDGEIAEGSVWEAASMASFYKLDNLCGIVDLNRFGQSQATPYQHDAETIAARWRAFGWHTVLVDGHDCEALLAAFAEAEATRGMPTMLIAHTLKGKGIVLAEDKDCWHGKPLSAAQCEEALQSLPEMTAEQLKAIYIPAPTAKEAPAASRNAIAPCTLKKGDMVATREQYGVSLAKIGAADSNVVVLDADTKNSTYSDKFLAAYPDRFFECFIAEQNMISVSCGLSSRGKVPFSSSFAAFLMRGFDQVRMAGVSGNNVKFCGSHVGVSIGDDGPSQMALEDLAAFRTVPGCVVFYPSDGVSAEASVKLAYAHQGMAYLRMSRPKTPVIYDADEKFEIGKCKVVRKSADDSLTVVAGGVTLFEALSAADTLAADGVNIRVIDLFSVKPVDKDGLLAAAKETGNLMLVVEDHYAEGGMGEAVAAAVAPEAVRVEHLAVPNVARSGKPHEVMAWAGIDAAAIVKRVKALL